MNREVRSRIMSSIRKENTKPEMAVRKFLHVSGLRYRLHEKSLPGRPDLVLPTLRSAVFVHGCFWHRCPHCASGKKVVATNTSYWIPKFERNKARDARVEAELAVAG